MRDGWTDKQRMLQILANLISNGKHAVSHNRPGDKLLTIRTRLLPQDRWHIEVADNGIGIPAGQQEKIFESFSQADGSATRKYVGAGLGLAITKQLVGLLGGKLHVTSEEGKGSLFSLLIPVGMDVTEPSLLAQHPTSRCGEDDSGQADPTTFSGKVLIVEDIKTNQTLIKLLFAKMGLDITLADDGVQALQKTSSQSFDLILMGIQMPNMNGYEAAKAIRQQGDKTPIVALTANAMNGDVQKCISAGCDDYLSKPIDPKKLMAKTAQYLPSK